MQTSTKAFEQSWTGGAYSLLRSLTGGSLAIVGLASLSCSGSSLEYMRSIDPSIALLLTISGIFFSVGLLDSLSAVVIAIITTYMFFTFPYVQNIGLLAFTFLAIYHLLLPKNPLGSFTHSRQGESNFNWEIKPLLYFLTVIITGALYCYFGINMLSQLLFDLSGTDLLQMSFLLIPNDMALYYETFLSLRTTEKLMILKFVLWLPLIFRPTRRITWLLIFTIQFAELLYHPFIISHLGFIFLLVTVLDPAWIKAKFEDSQETIFYDGDCGLCHRAVIFVLSEELGQNTFKFSALQSDYFQNSEASKANLGDSIIVEKSDGSFLSESSAVIHILSRLGGLWRVVGFLLWSVPKPIRDFGYRLVARVRRKVFAQPTEICPILPTELQNRFLS